MLSIPHIDCHQHRLCLSHTAAHRRHLDPTLARAVAFALLAQGFGLCLHIPPGGQMVNPKTNRSKDLWRPDIYLQV